MSLHPSHEPQFSSSWSVFYTQAQIVLALCGILTFFSKLNACYVCHSWDIFEADV